MRVLIACEESQRVCQAFRDKGHEAYSNDLVKCTGGHPEWHILMDARAVLNGGVMRLQNGNKVEIDKWDLIIAHPPCTYLTTAATGSHSLKKVPINWINARVHQRLSAMEFFMACIEANCDRIAVENPKGVMNTVYRKPDQIIEPYFFADSKEDSENYVTKSTCLWLKGLEPLYRTNDLEKPNNAELFGVSPSGKAYCWNDRMNTNRATNRSKTFPGVAQAMADQWG